MELKKKVGGLLRFKKRDQGGKRSKIRRRKRIQRCKWKQTKHAIKGPEKKGKTLGIPWGEPVREVSV